MINNLQYETFGLAFAKKAGKIIKQNFSLNMVKEWKADVTPVTDTDNNINSLLIKAIHKNFPGHSILAEEESHLTDSDYVWVCDPVDGTIPFSHGIPICTFSLALVHKGKSIFGVVYDPFSDRLFYASLGKGAFLNGKRIAVSGNNNFVGAFADFEMFKRAKYDVFELVENIIHEDSNLMKACSVIYPSMLLAAGEVAFVIFPHDTAHDAAAVKIIVEEAGGKVTDLFGKDQRYDRPIKGFIASNGLLHSQLVVKSKKCTKLNRQ